MTLTGNWSYPTVIKFGAGRIKELPEACAASGMKRPLLVTDKRLADLPIIGATLDILEVANLGRGLFSDVDPNPNEKNLDAGIAAYQAGGYDGLIAFGGGSGLDLGKMIAFMCGQTRPIWDFEDIGDWWTRANADAIAPIIAVPTTAGTGLDAFAHCVEAYSIPRILSDLGVTEASIPKLVDGAITDPSCGGNPVELTRANLSDLFKAAL